MPAVELAGGDWSMREALGETWRWYLKSAPVALNNARDAAARAERTPGWFPARVPGSVIDDLHRAGELPDPRIARNSRAAEWTAARHWVYRREVEVPALDGQTATLELDRVDPGAIVFWDGEELGSVGGLYHRARFELGSPAAGTHDLAVVVLPARASEPQVGRTDRVTLHAPRMNQGWDFCPRFPNQGLWRGIRLRIGPWNDPPVRVSIASGVGRVEFAGRGELRLDEVVVGSGENVIEVPEPERWWPNGFGPQARYELRIEHGPTRWIGFRELRMVHNPGGPADALPYSAVVNGVDVPLLGFNWVPADAQYGSAAPERIEHLVALARASGARLLRVWGGGLIETEEFYDACDRHGLLVWQEFSQSSSGMQSAPSDDPAFVEHLRAEAREVVPRLVHHPSLMMWGGGNELDDDGVPLDEARSPALAALAEEVARLDPGRHWVPTSPSGPSFHFRADDAERHDVHGPWEHQGLVGQHALYDAGTSLAHTEFGVEGMTNQRSLERLVPEAERWPTGRENPVYRHLGDWWNNSELVQQAFGGRIDSVERMRRASQWLQATGLAYAVEADRRRWPRTSMVIPWQLNESYPNAWCTSVVDYLGEPKPAYHAVARAFAPRRVTICTPRTAWAGEPRAVAEAVTCDGSPASIRALALDGSVLAEGGSLEPPDGLFLWEAEWAGVDREVVLATGGADLGAVFDLIHAELDLMVEPGRVTVSHRAGPAVIGLGLRDARAPDATGWLTASGDPRPLLPGETRVFTVSGHGRLVLDAFNTAPIQIRMDPA